MRATYPPSSYPDPSDRDLNPRWLALLGTAAPVVVALALGCYLRPSPAPAAAPVPATAPETRSAP